MDGIYRYQFSQKWRGYLIVPVEHSEHFEATVLNPFGDEIGDTPLSRRFASVDECLIAGKSFVDRDIAAIVETAPELIPLLQRAGSI